VVRRGLQAMPNGAAVTLPALPAIGGVIHGDVPCLSLAAADVQVAPLLTELSDYLSGLSAEATDIVRLLSETGRTRFSVR
jgi:hypothetical protein